jgi:predicted dehydrogenase
MIEAAIVGLGWWGNKLAQVAQGSRHVRFTLGVEPDPATAGRARDAFGFPVAADYAAALSEARVQAVVLATPHALHEDQIAAAAEAGKHVFCEKPLALTRASAERSVARMGAAELVLGIGHERRFEPPVAEALGAARAGELGPLLQVEANFSHDRFTLLDAGNWRLSKDMAPAGGMTATGIHMFDLATAMLGEGAFALTSSETLASEIPNGDTTCALVKYKSGATAYVATMLATPFISRFAVYGRNGWIEVRDKAHVEAPEGWILLRAGADGAVTRTEVPNAEPVRDNLDAFARAVAGEADYPITTAEMIANTAVMEAVFRSAESGGIEPVP